MQIAGNQCWICRHPVGTMREGAGCETCEIVVHRTCLENATCPKCGRSLLPTEQVHARASTWAQTERDRPRAVTVLARLNFVGVPIGAITALIGFFVMTTDVSQGIVLIFGGVLVAVLSAVLGSALLKGHPWARRFYVWVTPLFIASDVASGRNQLFQPGFSVFLFVLQVSVYGIVLFFVTRPNARAFFHKREEAPRVIM